ncbi:MAG: hypothetical protein JO369_08285 [Paucibacter sp.]|nr:hypothetical protein [Roseateles sp.]
MIQTLQPILTLTAGALALLLAHRLVWAQKRRRRVSEPAMRVHLHLQRLRRVADPARQGLPREDIEELRKSMPRKRRQQWDATIEAYREACRMQQVDDIERHLGRLIDLTMLD